MKLSDLLYIGVFVFMFVNIMTIEFYFESNGTHPEHTSSSSTTNSLNELTTRHNSNNENQTSRSNHGLSLFDDLMYTADGGGRAVVQSVSHGVAGTSSPPLTAEHHSFNNQRPIYFLHIYKSGGTSFCSTAHNSNKVVPSSSNCNLPRGISSMNVNQQLKILKQYQVAANEYDGLPVLDSMLMPKSSVSYVVMIRNPLNRFLSHFYAAQVFSKNNQGAFKNIGVLHIPPPNKHCLFHNCNFASFLYWLDVKLEEQKQEQKQQEQEDKTVPLTTMNIKPTSLSLPWTLGDFMLRYFVGFDSCHPGFCNETDLDRAKVRLEQLFDVILILEDLNPEASSSGGDGGGWSLMRKRYGWPSESQVKRAGTHQSSDASKALKNDGKALEILIKAVGERDIRLYEFALSLSRSQAQSR